MTKGYLVLETGEAFSGDWIGAEREIAGELVFNTSMTGYQEMVTDPSYAGQILTFTYPSIGNCGVNGEDEESKSISVSAVIASDICEEPSHYQSTRTFSEELKQANIPGLTNVDTRALVAVIRKHHTVRGKIVAEWNKDSPLIEWKEKDSLGLIRDVAIKRSETYGNGSYHVVLVDFGYKKSIVDALLEQNCTVTIVPYDTSLEAIEALDPDGILLSNGPGDPIEMTTFLLKIKTLTKNYPTLGIGLGHQLIALAHGGKTKKMPVGHRGGNYPVKELGTGKVRMTSQNHGYVVEEDSVDNQVFQAIFRNVNDKSLEGMKHVSLPVQSVQFHPEAHPGPSDTAYIFERFVQQVATWGGSKYAETSLIQ
ncbi:carbamoyl-phosphate synthase small subunit [Virgibacillus natechei]|uniref:Carbamoyl phosphate synthase small chain n=1 Tax=Virgibacillus natechei TaxID=1216297 RepID=A0ABS4IIF8_9BACI|nr:carbamoyl phosphate synthase small subunit [Virgibacillus natechei]MBP1970131.1 carbamoyl-phosphate synthase small subunit [Virgibacillus natechei]UZD14205.1 carbamoyl phosphate synthase small subunit [Virgibacillus natechei]